MISTWSVVTVPLPTAVQTVVSGKQYSKNKWKHSWTSEIKLYYHDELYMYTALLQKWTLVFKNKLYQVITLIITIVKPATHYKTNHDIFAFGQKTCFYMFRGFHTVSISIHDNFLMDIFGNSTPGIQLHTYCIVKQCANLIQRSVCKV